MKDRVLWGILVLAFCLRITGIMYGLPLAVVGDEPPFVLAALQMIELHTIIPALHPEAFTPILYYPPYISYFYLLPFVVAIGIKWLLWHGTSALFSSYLLSNLSVFFEIGRALMVILAVASVYLIYKVAESSYKSKAAARIAAFLLATSILDVSLSMVGRHWMPVSFLFVLTLFILTREHIAPPKRLFFTLLIAGFGAGISTASFLILIPIGCWFFFLSGLSVREVTGNRRLWGAGLGFILLAVIPSLLYRGGGQAFLGGFSLFENKDILKFFASPFNSLFLTAYSEPVLAALFVAGLVSLWCMNRRLMYFAGAFFLAYVIAFYFLFEFQPRFMLPLVPLYALVAPAAYLALRRFRFAPVLFGILLLIPLTGAARLSYLAFQNDTRLLAREWMLNAATPGSKILVYGSLMRLPTSAAGVAALRAIDPSAVRKTDLADEALNNSALPLSLNLSNVGNDAFFKNILNYAHTNGYEYLVVQDGYGEASQAGEVASLERGAALVKEFDGFGEGSSIGESGFTDPLPYLFSKKDLGPTVKIFRLSSAGTQKSSIPNN